MFYELFKSEQMHARLGRLEREAKKILLSIKPGVDVSTRYLKSIDMEHINRLEQDLETYFPNFSEVNRIVIDSLILSSQHGKTGIRIPNILIHGDPGIGKSFYVRYLAEHIDLPHHKLNFASVTAGMVLTGTSSKWGNSDIGAIARFLLENHISNGIFYIDEVDKASISGGDFGGSVENALLDLLEKTEAKHFVDEFVDIPMDASHINYFMLANDVTLIPDYIRSRCDDYKVLMPSESQLSVIVQEIYTATLKDLQLDGFSKIIDDSVIDALIVISNDLRSYRRSIERLLSVALRHNEHKIKVSHIECLPDKSDKGERNRIGFF